MSDWTVEERLLALEMWAQLARDAAAALVGEAEGLTLAGAIRAVAQLNEVVAFAHTANSFDAAQAEHFSSALRLVDGSAALADRLRMVEGDAA